MISKPPTIDAKFAVLFAAMLIGAAALSYGSVGQCSPRLAIGTVLHLAGC